MKTLLAALMSGTGAVLLSLTAPAQAGHPSHGHATAGGRHLASANHYGHGHHGYGGYPSYGGGYYGGIYLDPGYAGYGPQPTTIINNYYMQGPGQPPVAIQRPGGGDPSLLPPPTPTERPLLNVVRVDVNLPSEAELFIQNVKMPQTGTARRFVSPPLEAGQNYTYAVRAVWKANGREVTEARQLRVRAGDHQSITFLAPAETAQAGR